MNSSRAIACCGLVFFVGACTASRRAFDAGEGDGGGSVRGCDPALTPDICSPGGEACMPDYTQRSTTGYLCQTPGPFFNCVSEVGCGAADVQCVDTGSDSWVCLQTCGTTADCADPLTACAPLEKGGATFCLVNLCDDFWQPCPALSADGGDGTCVFVEVDPTLGPIGACLQAGTAPLNASCAYYRDAGGATCAGGTVCMVTDGQGQTGECMAICDAEGDGGPACAGACLRATPPAPPPPVSAFDFYNSSGGCASSCDPSGACPNGYSCYELETSGQLLCLP